MVRRLGAADDLVASNATLGLSLEAPLILLANYVSLCRIVTLPA